MVDRVVSKEDKYEAARNETVLAIAAWVKEHPRATQVRSQAGPLQCCQVTIIINSLITFNMATSQ